MDADIFIRHGSESREEQNLTRAFPRPRLKPYRFKFACGDRQQSWRP